MTEVVKEVKRSESMLSVVFILLASIVEVYLIVAFVYGFIGGAQQRELFLILGLAFTVLTLILIVYSLKFLEMRVVVKKRRYKPETRDKN
ncbi:MAG: hypothetical protein V3R86_03615 [Candidatus Hydrothermarchaeaceae archaeon]